MNLKIQLSGFFEIFGRPCPDNRGLAVLIFGDFCELILHDFWFSAKNYNKTPKLTLNKYFFSVFVKSASGSTDLMGFPVFKVLPDMAFFKSRQILFFYL